MCDLAIEAVMPRERRAVTRLLSTLLAEHLGSHPEAIAERLARRSLVSTLDAALETPGARTLAPVPIEDDEEPAVDRGRVADPERPLDPDTLLCELVPERATAPAGRVLAAAAIAVMVMVVLSVVWSESERSVLPSLLAAADELRHSLLAPVLVALAYVLGGLVFFPVPLLTAMTAGVFPLGVAIAHSLVGTLASASTGFLIGRKLHLSATPFLSRPNVAGLCRRLRRNGLLAVVAARLIPIAPFAVVNVVAGAVRVRYRDLALGTIIGRIPGTIAIALFTDTLLDAVRGPTWPRWLGLLVVASVVVGLALWMRARLTRVPRASGSPS